MAKKRRKPRTSPKPRGSSKKVRSGSKANPVGKDSPQGWRATLPVHPAAELSPLMARTELKDLAEDLRKSGGMNVPVALWRRDLDSPLQLLDGRNRLDALARILVEPLTAETVAAKFA